MGSLNYLIPTDTMSPEELRLFRTKALFRGYQRACDNKNVGSSTEAGLVAQSLAILNTPGADLRGLKFPKTVDVREFQPIADAATVLDQWNTAALVAVGTEYSCFQAVAAAALAANKLAVFYKVSIETIPVPVSRLIFRANAAAGNVLGVFDLEQIINHDFMEGYFSEPIVIDPSRNFAANVLCKIATGVLARVQLGGWIFEPAGQTVA